MTRVLVTGGRDYADLNAVVRALRPYKPLGRAIFEASEHTIIHGGCPTGADKLADEWCDVYGVRKRIYAADWAKHGKAAGPIRNQRMIDEGRPDIVLAFSGGRGTEDCIRRAEAAGIPVVRVGGAPPSSQNAQGSRDRAAVEWGEGR